MGHVVVYEYNVAMMGLDAIIRNSSVMVLPQSTARLAVGALGGSCRRCKIVGCKNKIVTAMAWMLPVSR
jgi:hypothetical protein